MQKTQALLERIVEAAAGTTCKSKFHEKRTGNGLSILKDAEITEFNSAKSAIKKDLTHLLNTMTPTGPDVVYSVHHSDINALSRLEINIIAHEISEFFGA